MKKITVILLSLFATIFLSMGGYTLFQVNQIKETLPADTVPYDDSLLKQSIEELVLEVESLEDADYQTLVTQVGLIQQAINEIETYDDTLLSGRVEALEAQVVLLNTLLETLQDQIDSLDPTAQTPPTIYVNNLGKYEGFLEVNQDFGSKYFNIGQPENCITNQNIGVLTLIYFNPGNTFTVDQIIARTLLFFEEMTQYRQYFEAYEYIEFYYQFPVGEIFNEYFVKIPTYYLLNFDLTFADLIPSQVWSDNRIVKSWMVGDDFMTENLTFNLETVQTEYNFLVDFNLLGNDILQPLE